MNVCANWKSTLEEQYHVHKFLFMKLIHFIVLKALCLEEFHGKIKIHLKIEEVYDQTFQNAFGDFFFYF